MGARARIWQTGVVYLAKLGHGGESSDKLSPVPRSKRPPKDGPVHDPRPSWCGIRTVQRPLVQGLRLTGSLMGAWCDGELTLAPSHMGTLLAPTPTPPNIHALAHDAGRWALLAMLALLSLLSTSHPPTLLPALATPCPCRVSMPAISPFAFIPSFLA